MPTVSLTAQQQAQVDAANKVLSDAQGSYDGAIANFNSYKNQFCDGWWNYLTNCDVKNAQSKALNAGLAASAVVTFGVPVASILNNWTQKKWEKPSSCQNAIDKGPLLSWDCDRGTGDCISVSGCNNRVNQYNAKLNDIYSAALAVDGEKAKVQSAKDNLNTVLAAIANDPAHKANVDIIDKEIDAQKQKDIVKWIFFGLAAVIIVGGALYIGTRMIGRGGAAA